MKSFPWKSRKYPIKYDEYGRSARQQAFELFGEGYRPAQIFKECLVPVSMKTLIRYFEDWKKQKHQVSLSTFKKYMKESPEFSEKYVKDLADYFEVTPEDIIDRIQKPWGIKRLTKGELPDNRLERSRSEIEGRLEAALRLIYLGEQIFRNSPKQIRRFLIEIVTLGDNTSLIISKAEGKIMIRKEKLQGTS